MSDEDQLLCNLGLPLNFGPKSKKRPTKRSRPNPPGQEPPRKLTTPLIPHLLLPTPKKALPFPISTIVAPMVGASELAFRLLCRKYGASLIFTEMFYSENWLKEESYRQEMFFSQLHTSDRPLVAQFCGNTVEPMVFAAKQVAPYCDAFDINLGCPQTQAKEQLFGSYLLDREHWSKVFAMVRAVKASIAIPVTCKIRLLPTVEETIEFVNELEQAGCDLVTIHGRQRGSEQHRRKGPADLEAITQVIKAVSIPIITNGNVRCSYDVVKNMESTGADGIMVAECLLKDPALFSRLCTKASEREHPSTRVFLNNDDCKFCNCNHKAPLIGDLALEYLSLVELYPPPGGSYRYIFNHMIGFLRRSGKGNRTSFHFQGDLTVQEIREKLADCDELDGLRALVRATMPYTLVESNEVRPIQIDEEVAISA